MAIVNSIVKKFTKIIAVDTEKRSFQVCVGRTDGEGNVNLGIEDSVIVRGMFGKSSLG